MTAAILFIALSIFSIFKVLVPIREEEEVTLYSYSMKTGSNYKVYLVENKIYDLVMEENLIYPKSIFDKLKLYFFAEFSGSPNSGSDIRADYIIEVKVRGFQMDKDEKRIVYEDTFPITSKLGLKFTDEAFFSEEVYLDFNQYESYVNNVESIIIADPQSEAEIIFRGSFVSKTEYGNKEEKFEYSIALPLFENLFSIKKPADIEKTGSITETRVMEKTIDRFLLIVPGTIITAMFLLIIYILKFSLPPTKEENRILLFKAIMRKHGSRIVRVNRSVNISSDTVFEIKDFEGMIKISDEYNIPIFYTPDGAGLPEENRMFIPGKNFFYTYYLNGSSARNLFYHLGGN